LSLCRAAIKTRAGDHNRISAIGLLALDAGREKPAYQADAETRWAMHTLMLTAGLLRLAAGPARPRLAKLAPGRLPGDRVIARL